MLHIAGAGTWLGANIVQAVVPRMALNEGMATASGWYRIAGRLAKVLYIPAAILILITGIAMVLLRSDEFGFGSTFVAIGFAMIVVGAVLGSLVFGPYSERAADAIQANDGPAIKATTGRLAAFGALDTVLLLVTITAMVLKLGA